MASGTTTISSVVGFRAYHAAQDRVDAAYADRQRWLRMAALNTARQRVLLVGPDDPGLHGGCLGRDARALDVPAR
jgi:glucan phosphorylase